MKKLAALILIFWSSWVFASGFVAKVTSAPCERPSLQKRGSGVLVSHGTAVYVLTSDHVVFHGDQAEGFCHSIEISGKSFAARFKAANILRGLALLQIVRPDTELVRAAIADKVSFSDSGDFVEMAGVPWGSEDVLVDKRAQVLSWQSTRPILPLQNQLLEIRGHSEFGMSGGAVIGSKGGFLGLLTHQYLSLQLGAPSAVNYYGAGVRGGGELIALAIPASAAFTWMNSVLRNNSEDIRMDSSLQMTHTESVVLSGVRFTARACKPKAGSIGGEGAGIGGEGAGIGGDGEKSAICKITVSLALKEKSAAFPFSENEWFKSLRHRLLTGESAEIDGVYKDGRRVALSDLRMLFTAVNRGYVPVTTVRGPFVKEPEVIARVSALCAQLAREISDLQKLMPDNSTNAYEYLSQVSAVVKLLSRSEGTLVSPAEVRGLAMSKQWNDVLVFDFMKSVSVRSELLHLAEELGHIQP